MPVIPALREAEAGGSVSLRPAWFKSKSGTAKAIHKHPILKKAKTNKQKY